MKNKLIKRTQFISFDGTISITTDHQRPDRYRQLEIINQTLPRIARGGGYSYSAASFGKNTVVQEMTFFNRFLQFDPLALTIKVESGMSLLDLLQWACRNQLYFPIIPGYPFITIGGCVAADVHGKNPYRDGTFSDWVNEITLFHPAKGYIVASRTTNSEIFALTCGGFGLSGIITDITLQLTRLPAHDVKMCVNKVSSLEEAIEHISTSSDDFAYSWHDGIPGPRSFGRGAVFTGNWEKNHKPALKLFQGRKMTSESRRVLPFSFWNKPSAKTINWLFQSKIQYFPNTSQKKLFEATFPFAYNTLYHSLFGRPGLREVQVLVPNDRVGSFLNSLRRLISNTKPPTMMMSIKRFRGNQKSLSLSGSGYLIAIDSYQNMDTLPFLNRMDELMGSENCQPNIAKDSRLSKEMAAATILNYQSFSSAISQYDSSRLFRSELSMRIGV